ncbi:TetR/AcrR family transcriptional regulator [Clostridium rectalis]|uniref:TetR/AcrR family transcriptional regulator n=1 Tax=Clostridium rectalis TaxID=2040295 RepID=UPI000F635E2F|nr:TetR/AcrR family transcriptional regulator [Clostridium rectalis]
MYTKQRLMESAFRLFGEKGADFSLNEVAEEVGIKKASIYAHFKSKEDLLCKVIEKEIDTYFLKINKQIESFIKKESHVEAILKNIFIAMLSYYDSLHKLYFWKRISLFPCKGFDEALVEKVNFLSNQRYGVVKKFLIKGIEDKVIINQPVESITLSYFSTVHGLLYSSIIYKEEDLTVHYEMVWDNFWRGIKY